MSTEPSLRLEDDHEQQHISSLPTEFPKLLRRSQSSEARIMIKNRRKRYLDTHPEYFSSPTLELAGLTYTPMMELVTDGAKTLSPTIV